MAFPPTWDEIELLHEERDAALEMHRVQFERANRMEDQRDELFHRLRIVLIHGFQCEEYDNTATEAALAAVDPNWMQE